MTTNVIPQQHLKQEAELLTLYRTRLKEEARSVAAKLRNNDVPQQHGKLEARLSIRLCKRLKEAPWCAAAKHAVHDVVLLIMSTDVWTGGRLHLVEKNCSEHDETSSQPLVKTGGEEDAHDNIKYIGCGSSCDLWAGEWLPKQRPLGDEHLERIPEEHLGEHDSPGRSGRFYRVTNQPKLERVRERKQGIARDHVCCSKEEWPIRWRRCGNPETHRRRRKMPKEERQWLKELSKEKMDQRRKRMKRHHDIERILQEFKGVRNIPRIKSAKKTVFITKIRTRKVNASPLEKESPIPLENTTKDSMKTVDKTTLNKKREMTKEFLKSRLKNYKVQSANLKLASLQTEMEYELKTSKIAVTRRERWWRKCCCSGNRNHLFTPGTQFADTDEDAQHWMFYKRNASVKKKNIMLQ